MSALMAIADLTLEELRIELAPALADAAVFDGWSAAAVSAAAAAHGVDPKVAALAYSGGAMTMIAAWIGSIDGAMDREFADGALAAMPIRERIRRLVTFRLDGVAGRDEALRRALTLMAMPQNARQSLRLSWASADAMWHLAGDTSTDYNHYTKRTLLAGIYAATLAVYAQDESAGKADTRTFLDRRIAGVMRFEKAKAQLLRGDDQRFSMARLLGRLRYPAT